MPPPSRRRPVRRVARLTAGPFVGLRDSLDPMVSNDPQRALAVENMYPLELDKPSVFVGRPGFEQAGSRLGSVTARIGQWVGQFTKLNGTEYTVAIVGGQGIYTYDWVGDAWTQVVTVANLTTASITLSETAHIYAVTFNDTLIVSDGVNKPFAWTGASGAGGLTSLTNAPVLYGQPRVHYAKMFGIKNTERNVEVWSEENDATIGYETAPYSNSWQLGQTDQEAIFANAPLNDVLYYLRARSTGQILGAVTPEFTADGTHEGVSQTVGTASPDGVVVVGDRVYFVDADARPHVIQGGQAKPLFDDIRETIRGLDRSKLANAITRYEPTLGLVLFGVVETGQTYPSLLMVYNPVLNVPVALWRGYPFSAMGVVKNADGVPVLMHLSSDGYAYAHGLPTGDLWDDELNAGTMTIRHAIETAHLGPDLRDEKRFLRCDVGIRADVDATAISLTYFTPYGASDALTASVEGNTTRWDEFNWDEAPWAAETVEQHLPFGLNGVGRWIRLRLGHEAAGEQFGVEGLALEYQPAGDSAGAP